MDIESLRYVVLVDQERGFSRAAEILGVSQANVSMRVAKTEEHLGFRLFDRSSRRVSTTQRGRAFVDRSLVLLSEFQSLVDEFTALPAPVDAETPLVISSISGVRLSELDRTIASYTQSYPAAKVILQRHLSIDILTQVAEGDASLGLVGLRPKADIAGVAFKKFRDDPLVAVVPAIHPLAECTAVKLADLNHFPFVDFPRGTGTRLQNDRAFALADLRRSIRLESNDTSTLLNLIELEVGIGVLPAGLLQGRTGLREVTITDAAPRSVFLAYPSFEQAPRTRTFLRMLEAELALGAERNPARELE